MTKFLIMLALSLLLPDAVSSHRKTDLESEGLKGPVHTVTAESSESIYIDGREVKGRDRKHDSLTFDSQGQLNERVIYDDYGFLVGKEKYSHDVEGRLITAELYDPKGRRQEKRVFTYRQDNLNEIITYGEKGTATLKQANMYDRKGSLQEEVYYYGAKAIGKTFYKIDDSGNAIEAAFFQPGGSKAVAPIGPCFEVHKVTYGYDSQGRVIYETAYELDGSVKRKASFRYDDRGNVAEEVRTGSLSTLKFVHRYEYDSHGNWIRQTIQVHTSRAPLFGDTPDESERTVIKIRKITYY